MTFAIQLGYRQTIASLAKGNYQQAVKQTDMLVSRLEHLADSRETARITFDVLCSSIVANHLAGNNSNAENGIAALETAVIYAGSILEHDFLYSLVKYDDRQLYPIPFQTQPRAEDNFSPASRLLSVINLEDYANQYHASLKKQEKMFRKGKPLKIDYNASIDERLRRVDSYIEKELEPRYKALQQREIDERQRQIDRENKQQLREMEKFFKRTQKLFDKSRKLFNLDDTD